MARSQRSSHVDADRWDNEVSYDQGNAVVSKGPIQPERQPFKHPSDCQALSYLLQTLLDSGESNGGINWCITLWTFELQLTAEYKNLRCNLLQYKLFITDDVITDKRAIHSLT